VTGLEHGSPFGRNTSLKCSDRVRLGHFEPVVWSRRVQGGLRLEASGAAAWRMQHKRHNISSDAVCQLFFYSSAWNGQGKCETGEDLVE